MNPVDIARAESQQDVAGAQSILQYVDKLVKRRREFRARPVGRDLARQPPGQLHRFV